MSSATSKTPERRAFGCRVHNAPDVAAILIIRMGGVTTDRPWGQNPLRPPAHGADLRKRSQDPPTVPEWPPPPVAPPPEQAILVDDLVEHRPGAAAQVLAKAPKQTPGQVRAATRRAVLSADPAAAHKRTK
ncbi:MAG: hypothetical protein ACRDTH_15470 [Pseudonocardiaceae bacterium]